MTLVQDQRETLHSVHGHTAIDVKEFSYVYIKEKKVPHRTTDSIDCVLPNVHISSQRTCFVIFEDSYVMMRLTMRRVSRSHRVDLERFLGWTSLDPRIQIQLLTNATAKVHTVGISGKGPARTCATNHSRCEARVWGCEESSTELLTVFTKQCPQYPEVIGTWITQLP